MQKGLALLAEGKILPSTTQLITPDTSNQINTLFTEFFADPSMTPEDAQKQFVSIIETAE
jgi:glucose/mannose transport system substrate-binding protein